MARTSLNPKILSRVKGFRETKPLEEANCLQPLPLRTQRFLAGWASLLRSHTKKNQNNEAQLKQSIPDKESSTVLTIQLYKQKVDYSTLLTHGSKGFFRSLP